MSRAILESSANKLQLEAGGFTDLRPLDQELASQLPTWDLVPPHAFLVRKPRKPKPVVVPQSPVEAAPTNPMVVDPDSVSEALEIEIEADLAPLAAEVSAPETSDPETMAEVGAEVPVTDIETATAQSPAARAQNCSECRVPLEPGSAFCSECGHKQ